MTKKENNRFVNINDFLLLVFVFCFANINRIFPNDSHWIELNWIDGWRLRGELGAHFRKQSIPEKTTKLPYHCCHCANFFLLFILKFVFVFFFTVWQTPKHDDGWFKTTRYNIQKNFDWAEKQRFKLGILLLFVWCIPAIKIGMVRI